MDKYNQPWVMLLSPDRYRNWAVTFNQTTYYSCSYAQTTKAWRAHENKHKEQYQRDGVVKFLCKYAWEYVVGRCKRQTHMQAYLGISYEVEARKAAIAVGPFGKE